MEFSFNSQRDGILPGFLLSMSQSTGFNSQRDGILRWEINRSAIFGNVSIPNGMEFYGGDGKRNESDFLVSIPNGMEFYSRGKAKAA